MGIVIREEWRASRRRIGITSIILAVIILGTAVVNFVAYQTRLSHVTFFGSFLYVGCLIIGSVGIPIYALVKGSGNIRSMLFEDTNYLTMLVPQRSYTMLAGRQILNLVEFFIYLIPAAFYLSFLGPTGGLLWNWFGDSMHAGATYWHNVRELYRAVFVTYPGWTVQVLVMMLISFAAVQATINCAFAIYAAFVRSKKPHKFLMAIIIFLLFYIEIRVSTWGMKEILFNESLFHRSSATGLAWYHLGIFAAFGAGYFALTGWLMENRIEV